VAKQVNLNAKINSPLSSEFISASKLTFLRLKPNLNRQNRILLSYLVVFVLFVLEEALLALAHPVLFQVQVDCCMLVAGVDEAGRGCVIGPLVVAGYAVETEKLPNLTELGVKDSKLLTPKKREALYAQLTKLTQTYKTIKLMPSQVDRAVERQRRLHTLNRLEAQTMAEVIQALKPNVVYVDAADVVEHRFKNHIKECLTIKTRVIAKHKADLIYPIVSAASIIAKVERDQEIAILRDAYGDFGSGYLTDQKTQKFMVDWLKTNKQYPPCIRKSWKPAKKALDERGSTQQTLP
jgi:ribonuclease HII